MLQMFAAGENQKLNFGGFVQIFGPKSEVLQMKSKCVSKCFISSLFTSDKQCPKIP